MTTQKTLVIKFFLPALLTFSITANHVMGFAEIARGPLLLQTTATLNYDSYFLGSPKQGDDYYATVTPRLIYTRNAGLAKWNASAGVSVSRYDENTRFDSEDIVSTFGVTLPTVEGARLSGDFNISYNEGTTVDEYVRDRIISNTFSVSTQFAYQLGLKTSFTENFSYNDTQRELYGDSLMWQNTLGFLYKDFLYGSSLSVNYQYNHNESTGVNYLSTPLDQEAHTISSTFSRPIMRSQVVGNVTVGYRVLDRSSAESLVQLADEENVVFSAGLTGPFLPPSRFPKIDSSMAISYESSVNPGVNDSGTRTFVGHISLGWNPRERTRLYFRTQRSLTLTANDLTVEDTSVTGGINQQIGLSLHANASVTYTWRDFRGIKRTDSDLTAQAGLSRNFNKYLSAGVSYQFQDKTADTSGFQPIVLTDPDYQRHLVSVSVTGTF